MNDLDELAAVRRQMQRDAWASGYTPCPVCGYRGRPEKRAKGSAIVAFALLLFGVLPGLIYMMFFSGYVWACAQCGAKKADA
jgi:hypothetical protein